MAERELRGMEEVVHPRLDERLEVVSTDLDIMERHAAELAAVEEGIQDEMKRWDREYKDARLHSTPRPRKHAR